MDISAPQKSFWGKPTNIFSMGNTHHGYKTSSSAAGEMDQEDTCATISTLMFWGIDATHRSCRAASSVREKGWPTEAEKKMWSRKFISQEQLWSCLRRTKVNWAFPPPVLGTRQPSHQRLFLNTLLCSTAQPGTSTSNRQEQRLHRI